MKKAKIVDPYGVGTFHEMFNSSFLLMCERIFDKIEYVSSKSSQKNIRRLVQTINHSSKKIVFRNIWTNNRESGIFSVFRMLMSFFVLIKEYFFVDKETYLFYIYNSPFSFVLHYINQFLHKKVYIVCHGELELCYRNTLKKTTAWKWYGKIWKYGFEQLCKRGCSLYFIVLGNSIAENMIKLYPQLKGRIIIINHPYVFDKEIEKRSLPDKKLRVGVVGRLRESKGLDLFLNFSGQLRQDVLRNNLEIFVVGQDSKNIKVEEFPYICWGGKNLLTRQEFDRKIQKLDYVLFFYSDQMYRFTASGALFDALRYDKPIIYLGNEYIDSIVLNKIVGFRCLSVEEMVEVVKKEINCRTDHTQFVENIERIKYEFSIEYNSKLLKQQLF